MMHTAGFPDRPHGGGFVPVPLAGTIPLMLPGEDNA